MKTRLWMFAAILTCGIAVLSSCTNEDNPAEPEKPVVSAERMAFENGLSNVLQDAAEEIRFDACKQALETLGGFFESIEQGALKEQIEVMIPEILNNTQVIMVSDLSQEDLKEISISLNDRFGMTEEDVQNMGVFMIVDAYNTIGTRKVTFQNGQATQGESDGFTIESIDNEGRSSSITLKFADERDGVRFFAARLFHATPVCIQLPRKIDISVSTANGVQMSGSVELNTDAPSRYISFKYGDWDATCSLTSDFGGRRETIEAFMHHTQERSFDLGVSLAFDGVNKLALSLKGMNQPYPKEYIESEELKSLRDCGTFFAAAYDVLKAINGSTIDEIQLTLSDKLVVTAQVNDVAGCLLALGNVRKMRHTEQDFETIDQYSRELNEKLHFNVAIKGTDIQAQGSILTFLKGNEQKRYQPGVALQFAGEEKPLMLFDRLTDEDLEAYSMLEKNINELEGPFNTMLESLQTLIKGISF